MADDNFDKLLNDPGFALGISLMGGSREKNPITASMAAFQGWQGAQARQQELKSQAAMQDQRAKQLEMETKRQQNAAEFAAKLDPSSPINWTKTVIEAMKANALEPGHAMALLQNQQNANDMKLLTQKQIEANLLATLASKEKIAADSDETKRMLGEAQNQLRLFQAQLQGSHNQVMEAIGATNAATARAAQQSLDEFHKAQIGLKNEAQQEKEQQKTDQFTERFANHLQQYKVPNLDASLRGLNDVLGKYKPDTLPGMGYAKNVPGAEFFLSDDGKFVKSKAQGVANDLLNLYSGLAVTVPEGERRALEQMSNGKFSAQDFYNAWPAVVSRYNTTIGNLRSGYPEQAIGQYQARPGAMNLNPVQAAGGQSGLAATMNPNANFSEVKEYGGAKYGLLPGKDRRVKDNWVKLP